MVWSLCVPCGAGKNLASTKPTVREEVVLMPAGSVVEVSLKNREKLQGRLGDVTNSGFALTVVKDDRTTSRALTFEEVNKVKVKKQGMGTASEIALGALAGLGVLVLIAAATGDWSR
jgi:hypothetical protein